MDREGMQMDEATRRFIASFMAIWDHVVIAGGTPSEGKGKYKQKPCPMGDPKELCKILNEWGKHWKDWADEVHKKLWPEGMSDPPDPPPPPPFLEGTF